jgi:3',5'-cyclic AMP phosphodiesterase CpdA
MQNLVVMKNLKKSVASLLRIWIIVVMQYFIITITVSAAVKQDTLTFLHITDSHIIYNLQGYHPVIEKSRKYFGNGIGPFKQFFKSVPDEVQADFVVMTGDLVDFYTGETSDGGNPALLIEQFVRLLDVSNIPVYLTLGNHDIATHYVKKDSSGGNGWDHSNVGRARAAWIRNAPCFRDGTYYSHIFKVDTTTYRFIFLDNSPSLPKSRRTNDISFYIDQLQLDWLDKQLQESDSDVEILFMHQPIPDSINISANLLNSGSSGINSNNDILSVLKKYSSAPLIFAGHNHENIINEFHFPDNYKLTQVKTGAFGPYAKNWRVIRLTGDNILISNPGKNDIQFVIKIR